MLAIRFLSGIIFFDVIASWIVPNPNAFPRNLTGPVVEPILRPIRSVINPNQSGGLDFSPLIVIVALNFIANAIQRAAF